MYIYENHKSRHGMPKVNNNGKLGKSDVKKLNVNNICMHVCKE